MLPFYIFKYAIIGIQFDNKKNYQKLIHDAENFILHRMPSGTM